MVNRLRLGQSMMEFIIVLAAMSIIAFILGFYYNPKQGALPLAAQQNAAVKIAQD